MGLTGFKMGLKAVAIDNTNSVKSVYHHKMGAADFCSPHCCVHARSGVIYTTSCLIKQHLFCRSKLLTHESRYICRGYLILKLSNSSFGWRKGVPARQTTAAHESKFWVEVKMAMAKRASRLAAAWGFPARHRHCLVFVNKICQSRDDDLHMVSRLFCLSRV